MIREFYTKGNQFVVSNERIFMNGEMIYEGEVHIQLLLLDQPASFIVSHGDNYPPTYFETEVVSAVLPQLEYVCRSHREKLLQTSF